MYLTDKDFKAIIINIFKEWKPCFKEVKKGNSLVVQWLGLHASTARGPGSIPGQGTKIHKLHDMAKKNNNNYNIVLALWKVKEIFRVPKQTPKLKS